MPEWAANPSWWVPASIVAGIALIGGVVKAALWVGKVNTKLESLGATVRDGFAEVRADIKKILERQVPPPAVQASSPVQLTSFGEKISAAASAREWAADHASRLTDEASRKQEFEVFEMCVAYVAEQIEKDEVLQRNIRKVAYEIGTEAEQVRKVYEVELRDRLLSLG